MTSIQMEDRLKKAYPDCQVAVLDSRGSGDYFEVRISSEVLQPMSRIQRHKAIMKVFSQELADGEIHALTIKIV